MTNKTQILAALLFTSIVGISKITVAAEPAPQIIEVKVTISGYEPENINVKAGVPIKLKVTRVTEATCAKEILVPTLKINKPLPINETVEIDLGKLKKGETKFGCAMGMMLGGVITAK